MILQQTARIRTREINDSEMDYQPRSNLVKDKNGDLLVDSCNTLNRWKNYFSQLLNIQRVSGVKQKKIRTAEQLVLDSSPFGIEIASTDLKKYKSQGSDQIPAKVIQAGSETLHFEIHNFFNSIWNTEELLKQWKESAV
jgi:hypothetical protein